MSARRARLTTREKLAIVEGAVKLIRRPDRWTTGSWKKEIYVDRRGRPVYAYCIDGAVNQATVNVLGLPRAVELGAAEESGYQVEGYTVFGDSEVCELLSVRRLAGQVLAEGRGEEFHDDGDSYQITLNDDRMHGHRAVLKVLRAKRRELLARVARMDAKREARA